MTWQEYQEQVASHFKNLGGNVATNKNIKGARASHDIDVYIEFSLWGQKIIWICECKLWKTSIPKEKVIALYQIVQDIGADRGLLFSESGFQSGAVNATKKTNISLLSLDEIKEIVNDQLVESLIITSIKKFSEIKTRINHLWINEDGFPETFHNISLDKMMLLDGTVMFISLNLQKALNNNFPITITSLNTKSRKSNSFEDLFKNITDEIKDIEKELLEAENKYDLNKNEIEVLKLELMQTINDLLTQGEKFILDSEKNMSLANEVLLLMRRTSDFATNLKAISRTNLNKHVNIIMRFLIDDIYSHLTKPEYNIPLWNKSKSQILQLVEEFQKKKNY